MLKCDQHLYQSSAIEVYGQCRLVLPWLRVPCWFFLQWGSLKVAAWPEIEPTTLDCRSQWGYLWLLSYGYPYRIFTRALDQTIFRSTAGRPHVYCRSLLCSDQVGSGPISTKIGTGAWTFGHTCNQLPWPFGHGDPNPWFFYATIHDGFALKQMNHGHLKSLFG